MSAPTQTCTECGRVETVTPDGRGFPPDIAKRKLKKRCNAAGCSSKPRYMCGLGAGLERLLVQRVETEGSNDSEVSA
jgi:hypothetical protein